MCDVKKVDLLIKIMGFIGIVFSMLGLFATQKIAIWMLVILPFACIVLFMITKHPSFGFAYTALFILNRLGPNGTLASYALIIALSAFFIYVDRQSVLRWKEVKKGKA